MKSPGEQLEYLCRTAIQELVLVAPFIKVATLERLLVDVSPYVAIKCVTRWRPDEIAVGVSDIEIWPLLKGRSDAVLWLRPDLHAKFYRADNRCLVGSANLTNRALGWSYQQNFELLVPLFSDQEGISEFERNLMVGCVQVDDEEFEYIREVTEQIDKTSLIKSDADAMSMDISASNRIVHPESWLPALRHPESLYIAYSGELEQLSTASRLAATEDLAVLSIPAGLSSRDFENCVGMLILQMPIVRQVDQFVIVPQRFGAVSKLLSQLPCSNQPNFEPDRAWQTLMRWLRYFLPHRYILSTPNHSEIFHRRLET